MPNWCDNNISISGPKADTDAFFARIDHKDNDMSILQTFLPMPAALAGTVSPTYNSPEPHPNWANMVAEGTMTQERYDELCAEQRERYEMGQKSFTQTGYYDWYDWQTANWGVKWGDSDTQISKWEDGSISGTFTTPWGPPIEGIIKISRQFPNCTFHLSWSEEGVCLIGAVRIVNGEQVQSYEIDDADWPDWNEDDDGVKYAETIVDLREKCEAEVGM